jgi:RNase P subunit RPR2
MKPPAGNTQSGRYLHEPKKVCSNCNIYMYKQSSRKMINGKNGWIPTSWLCRKCGHMEIYENGFEAIRDD